MKDKIPCEHCPWVMKNKERYKEVIKGVPGIREAVAGGAWIACHVHMGTCHGAELWSNSKLAEPYRENKVF